MPYGNLFLDIHFFWLVTKWCLIGLFIIFFAHAIFYATVIYLVVLIIYLYKKYCSFFNISLPPEEQLTVPRKIGATIFNVIGRFWHSYEIEGIENLPEKGGALIIYYHGAVPLDYYYFASTLYLKQSRMPHAVAERRVFNMPGMKHLVQAGNATPGSVEICTKILENGNLLAIAPGGMYEQMFSRNYEVMFKNRVGFAKAAINAKVPIIPMFTENIREAYPNMFQDFFRKLYDLYKLQLGVIYGAVPVKLVTHLGKPIPYDANLTPEMLQGKVIKSLEELIRQHQKLRSGNPLHSLLERIPQVRKKKKLS